MSKFFTFFVRFSCFFNIHHFLTVIFFSIFNPFPSFNNGVTPACLPDDDIRDPDKSPDFPPHCYTAGFGKYDFSSGLSEDLREMPADIYTNEVCNEKFKHEFGYSVREETEICAGDITGFNSTCNGDSGSSLICIENEMPVLRGVTSWGVSGCQERSCDFFAELSQLK
jgi:hypothetical protein